MRLVMMLPSTTICVGGKPYLTRYYVFLRDWKWLNVYIHHFHASDQGDELHSHPWMFGFSLVLSGGYVEERRVVSFWHVEVEKRLVMPGDINRVAHDSFHRVDLLDETEGAWTLFLAGPRKTTRPEWEFWNRHTGEFTDWRENPDAIP